MTVSVCFDEAPTRNIPVVPHNQADTNTLPPSGPCEEVDPLPTPPEEVISIHHLPLELLLDIFAYVDEIDSWHPLLGLVRGRGFANLMRICREWCTIICTTPAFWRVVDLPESSDLVSLYLHLSRGCTLDVRISSPCKWDPPLDEAAISQIVPHAARIRSLSVHLPIDDFHIIEPVFEAGLPALRHLDVVPVRDSGSEWGPWLGLGLSRAKLPHLRSLIVKRVELPPLSAFWRSLRVLKLYQFPMSSSGIMPARDVLDILRQNATLEEVHLLSNGCLGAEDAAEHAASPSRSPRKVFCPNLRIFVLHSPLWFAADLLSGFTLPKDIPYVDIRVMSLKDNLEGTFVSLIPPHFRFLLERMSEVSLHFAHSNGGLSSPVQFTLSSPPRRRARVREPEMESTLTSISFESADPGRGSVSIPLGLRNLARTLALKTVRHLHLAHLPAATHADADTYEALFDGFPSLESLSLYPSSPLGKAKGVVAALRPERHEDGTLDALRCPRLRTLRIHERSESGSKPCRELLDVLFECVRARAEAGARLDEVDLHLRHGRDRYVDLDKVVEHGMSEAVERVRGHVGKLLWKYGCDRLCEGCGN